MAEDELFRKNAGRVKNRSILNEKLRRLIAAFPLEFLLSELERRFVPAGAVKDIATALESPAAKALQLQSENATFKGLKTVGFKLEKVGPEIVLPPPHFGEHTVQVLKTYANVPETSLDALQTAGAVYQNPEAGSFHNPSPQNKV